jgi:hypothetical protein
MLTNHQLGITMNHKLNICFMIKFNCDPTFGKTKLTSARYKPAIRLTLPSPKGRVLKHLA